MLCAGLCSSERARAQAVVLDLSGCAEPSPSEVRALLGVELHDQLVGEGDLVPGDAQTVEVRCTQAEAELRVRETALRRVVALASVPAGLRARVLALSIAELARPQPIAAPPQVPPPTEVATEPEESEPDVEADAEAEAEAEFPDDPFTRPASYALWAAAEGQATPLLGFGGSVLLRVKLQELLAWSSAVSIGQARTDIDRGKLRVLSVSLRTGLALVLESSRASFHVGAGVRGGWLQLTGEPSVAADTAAAHFDAWFVGPALFGGVSWRVASHVFIALELEVDHTLREVRANVEGGEARTLSPWRSSGALGAGLAW
jgi:opacity protein-like surface antigen